MSSLRTNELSKRTWPDFEWFFSQGNGWDHCGCLAYQGIRPPRTTRSWAEKRDWNLATKCELVSTGRAHGILVYDDTSPVGWCQYGPADELPLQERDRAPVPASPATTWRITCFCTAKGARGRGVAETALTAALEAIARGGGGAVEACPVATIARPARLDPLVRAHGGRSEEVRACLLAETGAADIAFYDGKPFSVTGVTIGGVGPLTALVRRMPGALHPGSVRMFEKAGFVASSVVDPTSRVRPFSRVVMTSTVPSTGR